MSTAKERWTKAREIFCARNGRAPRRTAGWDETEYREWYSDRKTMLRIIAEIEAKEAEHLAEVERTVSRLTSELSAVKTERDDLSSTMIELKYADYATIEKRIIAEFQLNAYRSVFPSVSKHYTATQVLEMQRDADRRNAEHLQRVMAPHLSRIIDKALRDAMRNLPQWLRPITNQHLALGANYGYSDYAALGTLGGIGYHGSATGRWASRSAATPTPTMEKTVSYPQKVDVQPVTSPRTSYTANSRIEVTAYRSNVIRRDNGLPEAIVAIKGYTLNDSLDSGSVLVPAEQIDTVIKQLQQAKEFLADVQQSKQFVAVVSTPASRY
jgi:hypothetical protein